MRALWRSILVDPDDRSPREVDRDVDDELAFHLDQIERELRNNGTPPAQVRADALARFGDPGRYGRLCRAIALKERIMLQRLNLALLLLVAIAVGLTAWQSLASQRRTADAVDRLAARLETMTSRAAAPPAADTSAPRGQDATDRAAVPSTVIIAGDGVAKPGVYSVAPEGFTLRRLLAAAGATAGAVDVTIRRRGAPVPGPVVELTAEQLAAGEDTPVFGGDRVAVIARGDSKAGAAPGSVNIKIHSGLPR